MIVPPAGTQVTVRELSPDYQVFDGRAYHSASSADLAAASTVYFRVDARKYGGHFISVWSPGNAHLFVNGRLVSAVKDSALFSIDELRSEFGEQLFVGIHAPGELQEVSARIVSLGGMAMTRAPVMALRPPTFFRDFGILASLILMIFLLVIFRSNPQLTLDYFSFSKVFSSSERNETQLASRITSSENLLFYLFSALLMGFLLTAILYSSGADFMTSGAIKFGSLAGTLWIWLRLSFFILLLLAGKLLIVLVFSTLYNFRETVSFQFFNFLRFVLFTAVILAAMNLLFFVFRIQSEAWYERLIVLGLMLLTIGSVVVFLKLLGRLRFSLFHLFSYLCISEFIPLVILFKIFF